MKKILIALMLIASPCFGAGQLEQNANGTYPIQGFAPDGRYAAVLTVNSTWYDMTNHAAYAVYAPADFVVRMAASQSKTGTVSETMPGGQWHTIVTSAATPYFNVSSATNGRLRRSTPKP